MVKTDYDIAIVGGGLAGLATAIQLAKKAYSVVLFEKEEYPFQKVCGEYVSLESWAFLESLGLPLHKMSLPLIDTLQLTAPNGKELFTKLPLGGFGISRYLLDKSLADIAAKSGVTILQKTKVDDAKKQDDLFVISFPGNAIKTKVCCAAYGKRNNLDVKWKRPFLRQTSSRLNNYIGIKYHVKTDWKDNVIGLHNFENGYCGISKIEGNEYCLCYMTKAENLKACDNSIEALQENILAQNPHLKKIFSQSEVMKDFPVTISQINFGAKEKVQDGILMLGDAAGMITPLCGNGMSIALHTAKLAAALIDAFLQGKFSQSEMEEAYKKQWNKAFASRLKAGRFIQSFFGGKRLSNFFVGTFKAFPFLTKPVIKLTHGKPF
ncbi:NAD(P)/FAD-dependent oxidoreductase [Flavisolibacter ginsenosidimutans]|uniref:NAD(P)/FAD-dependent oxidoreductase n=1 Tax=Flavisolibacter ginsenosidimutans TaxID=661481 RepID=A0A5B8UIA4_9BACT|nr:NAD(P)/FAD-dependent oxidoreductase [Flavisolibacter ginsenosidimutans]QEC56394.1 NAD(P)/FAD-dependent oxidoreductase [Flavisolibacter ginsenosidimutans]